MITVKSDASGSGRWCFFVVHGDGEADLVWGRLSGDDAAVHVPYYELAAVYECVAQFGHTWSGRRVRFGVDSAPVMYALNNGTSRDVHMMRLLREIEVAGLRHAFEHYAVHTTRTMNQLTDQGTRHTIAQDFASYLPAEGFDRTAAKGTAAPSQCSSLLTNDGRTLLRLGQQHRCSAPGRASDTTTQ